jgi:meso-butanediol dehydrogenase / (S,S)-butanediol dehydrogenase / diacetyl reductase
LHRFQDRVALVTGAGRGIGKAIAVRLSSEGASVLVAEIDPVLAEEAAAAITEAGGRAASAVCDVTDNDSVRAAIRTGIDRFGRLDVLVTNVGVGGGTPFEEIDDSTWAANGDPTLQGTVRSIQAALPHLLVSPVAAVVMIGSVNGLAAAGDLVYSTAKAALPVLAQNLAVIYGRRVLARERPEAHPIRFNVVAPGTVRTSVWDGRGETLDKLGAVYPAGRVGEPEDIAAAVAFLASDDASWITGVTLPVDGGLLTGPAMAFDIAQVDIDDKFKHPSTSLSSSLERPAPSSSVAPRSP